MNIKRQLQSVIDSPLPVSASLMDGRLGVVAYLLAANSLYDEDNRAGEKAADILYEVFEQYSDSNMADATGSLKNGITGFCYLLNKFRDHEALANIFDENFLKSIDELIVDFTFAQINNNSLGYLSGAAGNTYYLNQRAATNQSYHTIIENIVKQFERAAVFDADGLRYNPGQLHANWDTKDFINHYNLSLSDGLVGILLTLLSVYETLGNIANVKQLITDGIKFILGLERPVSLSKGRFCFFPTIVSNHRDIRYQKREFYNSRLGWCTGDLTVALLLSKAGATFNNPFWIQKGTEVGEFTLNRKSKETTKVEDSAFCHGDAGIATVYKSLYKITGKEAFLTDGYSFWISRLINNMRNGRKPEFTLLNGDLAQLLAYADYQGAQAENWKDIFLL